MIFQIANIIAGALLSSDRIRTFVHDKPALSFLDSVESYRSKIGVAILVLGVLALIQRLDIYWIGISGASFPQAIPLLGAGLLLGAPILEKYTTAVSPAISVLKRYQTLIGVAAVASGVGSLMFGCVLPLVCHVPF